MLAANLASIAPVLITYRADLEQLLVLLPLATAMMKAIDGDLTPCVGHAQSQECPGGSEMIQRDGKEELSR